jgi:hypothetical protein
MHRWNNAPQALNRYQISTLIYGLGESYTYAFKSVKGPGNTFDLNPSGKELCLPPVIFQGICKASLANPNIKVAI